MKNKNYWELNGAIAKLLTDNLKRTPNYTAQQLLDKWDEIRTLIDSKVVVDEECKEEEIEPEPNPTTMNNNDLSNAKVGDKVWIIRECEIHNIEKGEDYPIEVKGEDGFRDSFTFSGTQFQGDKTPVLFTNNPFESQEFKERVMWVWDNQESNGEKQLVEGFFKGQALVTMDGQYVSYKHAKELNTAPSFTPEQVEYLSKVHNIKL